MNATAESLEMDMDSDHHDFTVVNTETRAYTRTVAKGQALNASKTNPTQRSSAIEYGSGWYHDEAIKDAREAHAHPYR